MWFLTPDPAPAPSDYRAPADEPDKKQHYGNDQQYPDEVTQCVAADHSQKPQNDQNDRNGFKHLQPPQLTRSGVIAPTFDLLGITATKVPDFPTSSGRVSVFLRLNEQVADQAGSVASP